MKKFTESHEWVMIDHDIATIGVSHHAQKELGDIVYVELPKIGKDVHAGNEAAVLESTKAAADVYSPISGTIIEVNEKLKDHSELINNAAETDGWIFKLKIKDSKELDQLLSQEEYQSKFS